MTDRSIALEPENTVLLAFDGHCATITINRPKALNALNADVLNKLEEAVQAVSEKGSRALIITGAGRAFVAGADIAAMAGMDVAQATRFARRGQAVLSQLEALHCPVIAAVNGFALGGGCELALACDIVYASEKAKFGQPEVKLGVIPGFGGTQRLVRRVGAQAAAELTFTGRMITATEARAMGLVAAVHPADELLAACHKLADSIAEVGPLAVAAAKSLILAAADLALEDGLGAEAERFGALFETHDQREGMSAFLDKRHPEFTGT